ncbi:MAG: hypothetical protein ABJN26_00470 [Stappiaceae bacterium]
MSDWKDISTAPKAASKEKILVFNAKMQAVQLIMSEGDWWRWRHELGEKIDFSHWMPLPLPPEEVD